MSNGDVFVKKTLCAESKDKTTKSSSSVPEPAAEKRPYGLKVAAEGQSPVIDIVAIHGLNGHRDKTWTAANGVHWLRDLLPNDIPNARIFCWGYDANTHGRDISCQYLHNHAQTLVSNLVLRRELTETTRRPIIFVAHSLGGIIVKSALIHSDAAREGALKEHRSIKTSTYGVFFMGTPHQGGNGVLLGQLLLNVASVFVTTDDRLMRHLGRDSEWLQQQLRQYEPISREFVTKFAFEEYKTPTIGGRSIMVVPRASAVVPGAADAEQVAIHADHRNMVRFESKENDGYQTISGYLTLMTRRASDVISSRWKEEDKLDAALTKSKESFSVGFSLAGVLETPHFVARHQELADIHTALSSEDKKNNQKRVVLHGLGGIGKTQLAVAYAKRHKSDYSAVFWLNIKDEDAVKQSYARMAKWIPQHCSTANQLNSIADSNSLDGVVAAVMQWLNHPENTRWLMVFDNYDNPKLHSIPNPTAVEILEFLPNADHGSILITTRSSQVGVGHRIQVRKLPNESDSLQILCNASRREDALNDPSAVALAKELDGLPLALATAGAYLEQVATSFQDYLRLYKASWLKLQQTTPGLESYDQQLYTTWQLSYDHIRQQNELSAKLLQLWAYFDNQDLWFELLKEKTLSVETWRAVLSKENPASLEWFAHLTQDEHTFNEAMRLLCNHGLAEPNIRSVSVPIESSGYSMHNCVHEWTIHLLNHRRSEEMSRISLFCVALHRLSEHVKGSWVLQQRLIHHAFRCSSYIEATMIQDCFLLRGILFLGVLFQSLSKLKEAGKMYWFALKACGTVPGTDYRFLIGIFLRIGSLFVEQGKPDKAEELFRYVLLKNERRFGPDDEIPLRACEHLGYLYKMQGEFSQAVEMYQRALQSCEKTFGSENDRTIGTLICLGNTYLSQERLEKAEEILSSALHRSEKAVGLNHPSTLEAFSSLGLLYQRQKKCRLAEDMFKRALRGQESALGLYHLSTWATLSHLGVLYRSHEQLEKATEIYERLLKGQGNTFAPENPWTLDAMTFLGAMYALSGRRAEAGDMLARALEWNEKALELEHPLRLDTHCIDWGYLTQQLRCMLEQEICSCRR